MYIMERVHVNRERREQITTPHLMMITVGVAILSFVTLYILGIGIYVGDSVMIAIGTAIIGYIYNNGIALQRIDDNVSALGNRLDASDSRVERLENKVFK